MGDSREREVARALLEVGAVGFMPHEPIRFKSGIVSPVYIDNRILPYYPRQWHLVVEAFASLIKEEAINFDLIGGIAVGGVPHSAALSYMLGKPSIFIRQSSKEHGKGRMIEGGEVCGKHVLLVEDHVTTGESSLHGVYALRQEKALINESVAIVSYGFSEAVESFAQAGVHLYTLTQFNVITQMAMEMGRFGSQEKEAIDDWLCDPRGWASRQGIIAA